MMLSSKARFGFRRDRFLAMIDGGNVSGEYSLKSISGLSTESFRLKASDDHSGPSSSQVILPSAFSYLAEGDIVRLNPLSDEVRVLYRRNSRHNALFLTERCNSRCVMCSQPPREIDDGYLVDEILAMLPWMAKDTPELGITGGEPTLLGDRLIKVVAATKQHLPTTPLHMLSNGRLLAYAPFARKLGDVCHPDFMVGIPLYSDLASAHDFVVQAKRAFEQTIFGILNLARVGVRVELRMVIHRETFARLPQFARYVARNLPFVAQVVLMGLEPIGFARSNFNALRIDPADYQDELEECALILADAGLNISIYNHQLCVLRRSLWPFARKSISDWKNIYLPECEPCARMDECGGFFASVGQRPPAGVRPFPRTLTVSGCALEERYASVTPIPQSRVGACEREPPV